MKIFSKDPFDEKTDRRCIYPSRKSKSILLQSLSCKLSIYLVTFENVFVGDLNTISEDKNL